MSAAFAGLLDTLTGTFLVERAPPHPTPPPRNARPQPAHGLQLDRPRPAAPARR